MLISTKGRYALRVMIDLAEHNSGEYSPLKDVADRQEISLKYLEKILPVLTKARFLEGAHGKGGGYRLKRDPETCTVWEILQVAEGNLAPVSCLEDSAPPCKSHFSHRSQPIRDFLVRSIQNSVGLLRRVTEPV